MTERNKTSELGELTQLLYSSTFHKLLQERKVFLQKEVNRYVKEQKLIEAYGALMKLEDVDKLVVIMTKRLEELKKEK